MPASNTATRYGSVTKSFHWLTALLILTVIPLGIIANGMAYDTGEALARKAWLFSLHKTIGVAIFFVALARIGWALSQPKPAPIHAGRRAEHFLAEVVHWLLYGSLLIVPLTGWVHHAATTGFAPIWWPFGQDLPFVPKSDSLAGTTAGLHIVFERVLALSIFLHVAGALKHAFIDKDATLARMWPGKTEAGISERTTSYTPIAGAVAVWIAAVGIGSALGIYASHSTPVQAAALEQVQSQWQVQDGDIAITVTQFGSQISGRFADWTAEIAFDPDTPELTKGTVTAVISIPSLTLGSVTDQAMGPDFFDAQTHQTAIFTADLIALPDEMFEAKGTLSIKDVTMPLTLPFTLDITGDTAVMSASTTLNRLDFTIGANMPDESSLAFAVDVAITLTATQ